MVKAIQSGSGKSGSDDQPHEIGVIIQEGRRDGKGGVIVDPPQYAPSRPIPMEEFNKEAHGGPIVKKSWERALSEHQQRRASTPAPKAPSKPKPNW